MRQFIGNIRDEIDVRDLLFSLVPAGAAQAVARRWTRSSSR